MSQSALSPVVVPTPIRPRSGTVVPFPAVEAKLPQRRITSRFEFWPDWAIYTPVVLQWILLGFRYMDFSLPSAANPSITTGGLCGESKSAILDLAQPYAQNLIPRYTCVVPKADCKHDTALVMAAMRGAGLDFPVVVKPDIGCNGAGVRLVESAAALPAKLAGYPAGAKLMVQALVPWDGEAGIFYMRGPDQKQGQLTSLTLKSFPSVIGDGVSTLRDLVLADPRAGRVPHLYLPRLIDRLHAIPGKGEVVRLVFSGNHCKGSVFKDGADDITPALRKAIDRFAQAIPGFHFGRIDVRYESLASLRAGEGFRVIEVNGVGSEATHIWDPDTSLWEAYRSQFKHTAEAFRIGALMKRRGAKSSSAKEMWRSWQLQRRLLAAYPLND